mgnify:CR=1 FL=1
MHIYKGTVTIFLFNPDGFKLFYETMSLRYLRALLIFLLTTFGISLIKQHQIFINCNQISRTSRTKVCGVFLHT